MTEGYVMVVDDDPDLQEALGAVLEARGYRVVAASNGQNALELLQRGPLPSLILLDMMMPIMDGLRFREEQLRRPRMAAVPVVMFSASRQMVEAAGRLGLPFLDKPINLQTLMATVARHVS